MSTPRTRPEPADRLATLVAALTPGLRAFVRQFAVEPQDCDDILQDVWMLYLLNRHQIIDQERTAAWLRTTASRRAMRSWLDARREHANQAAVEHGALNRPCPAQEMTLAEQRDAVRRAVAKLPERDRRLAGLLATRPGLSYAELAALLGVARNSVGQLRRRCLTRLRTLLAAEGITDPCL